MSAVSVPRVPPFALIALVLGGITLAVIWRPGLQPVSSEAPIVARDLRFEDLADGGVRVRDARDGGEIALLAPASNAFIRGALRALVRDRRLGDRGSDRPFRVAAWADGRLTLEDTATGRTVALEAFGATNAGAFARLLAPTLGRP
jgi:putative photosynthetic complex assembly protein